MLKLNSVITRRGDLDLAAFSDHWRTTHRELALRLVPPGIMRGYVQNHRQPEGLDGLTVAGDGVPELWVEKPEDILRLGACPEYLEGAYLDEPNFMEGRARNVISELAVIRAEGTRQDMAGKPKLMLFLTRRPGISAAEFADWGKDAHPVLMPDAAPLRLERQMAAETLPEPLTSAYDAVECSWWPDMASLHRAWRARDPAPAARFIDTAAMEGMVVREEPVLWPDARHM